MNDERYIGELPPWVKPGITFRYDFGKTHSDRGRLLHDQGRVFHIRGVVDGHAVIREWWKGKQRWNYSVEGWSYFDAYREIIVVDTRHHRGT